MPAPSPSTLVALIVASAFAVPGARAGTTTDFQREIRPILSNHCFKCHGPDEQERKGGKEGSGGLRLDTEEGSRADLGGIVAIVPGHPENSELIARITTTDKDDLMPPTKSGKKLTPHEIELLTAWVKSGGTFARHWSYEKPIRVQPPKPAENPIDAFILARLEKEGLKPQPEATRTTLIRRLALDLTGLPPTVEEVDAFVNDTAPDAYARLVERLLASPAYGEHWARTWLDLSRYADSAGYADDPPRTIWAFRDYVIRAFNANKPFDQFSIEQLAGDLLPNPTEEQLIATAFHRNTMTNNEGGTQDEEFRNAAVVDRVNTTMAVWMGTSMACAQCHTHKYDPISQTEYFRLFAFFNNTEDADRKDETPLLTFFSDEQKTRRGSLEADFAALDAKFKTSTPALAGAAEKWAHDFPAKLDWQLLTPATLKSQAGLVMHQVPDGAVLVPAAAAKDTYTVEVSFDAEQKITAFRLEALPHDSLPGKGPGHAGGNFVITRVRAVVQPSNELNRGREIKFSDAVADFVQADFDEGLVVTDVAPKEPKRGKKKRGPQKGWAIGGSPGVAHNLTLLAAEPINVPAGASLVISIEQQSPSANHTLGHFRLGATNDLSVTQYVQTPREVIATLGVPPEQRDAKQREQLISYYVRDLAPELAADREKLATLRKQIDVIAPNTVPIFKELAATQRRKTRLQLRGNYRALADEVTEGVPAAFPPVPPDAPMNRLTLARWLVDENNPLTARVIANRFWETIFGTGLVRTSEEFGAQGELPSHPELLDWLATELVRQKWDVKKFLTLLVTSATYRQSSKVTPELFERDPDNRLLARGPRFRMSAEMVRDQALAVSGLYSRTMYGPSVRPVRPALGLAAAFGGGLDWQASSGDDKHRRALYTEWRRTSPYPSMVTFDAPNREVCTLRRNRTNTPLQALVTMNDPVYVEAAQALARRMIDGATLPVEQVRRGFRAVLARTPSDQELQRLIALHDDALAFYKQDTKKAAEMATNPIGPVPPGADVAELAAWTTVASVLLNLDETLMKR